jgi:hypothetical protein
MIKNYRGMQGPADIRLEKMTILIVCRGAIAVVYEDQNTRVIAMVRKRILDQDDSN